jgi:lipase chaperone LimK
LTSLTIPSSVTAIGTGTLPTGATILRNGVTYTIGASATVTAFNNTISVIDSKLFDYFVTAIANNAFTGSTLTSLTIPTSVTAIGTGTLPTGATILRNGVTYTIGASATVTAFNNTISVVTIDSKLFDYFVTAIADNAFFGKTLSTITIPSSVLSIGAYAVSSCPNLTTVTIQ